MTGIVIEGATLTPAKAGQSSRIRMKITNLRTAPLFLTGIDADFSRPARIQLGSTPTEMWDADMLPILRDETLELDTSHIQAAFQNVDRKLNDGEELILRLDFNGIAVEAIADVH